MLAEHTNTTTFSEIQESFTINISCSLLTLYCREKLNSFVVYKLIGHDISVPCTTF